MGKSWIAAIAESEAQLGADTLARMAKIFIDDSSTQLGTIAAALARKELATARGAAHDLVANAGSMCFAMLEGAARECERACIGGNHTGALVAYKSLPALVDICVVLLRDRYNLK